MRFAFVPMNKEYTTRIVDTWKYENQYSIYDYSNEAGHMLDSDAWGKGIFAVLDQGRDLVGELSIEFVDNDGSYLEYRDYGDEALTNRRQLWAGFGLRPDLVGQGRGAGFVAVRVDYAIRDCHYGEEYVYLGVAVFSQRAVKAYEKAGFQIFDHTLGDINGKPLDCVSMHRKP